MGEVLISCFLGFWLSLAGVLAYRQLKKEWKGAEDSKK